MIFPFIIIEEYNMNNMDLRIKKIKYIHNWYNNQVKYICINGIKYLYEVDEYG